MHIIVHTLSGTFDPLFKSINEKIQSKELKTWEIRKDNDNNYVYNHTPDQWNEQVAIQPFSNDKGLELKAVNFPGKSAPTEALKGYVIGRFVEMLMVHFRGQFDYLEIR